MRVCICLPKHGWRVEKHEEEAPLFWAPERQWGRRNGLLCGSREGQTRLARGPITAQCRKGLLTVTSFPSGTWKVVPVFGGRDSPPGGGPTGSRMPYHSHPWSPPANSPDKSPPCTDWGSWSSGSCQMGTTSVQGPRQSLQKSTPAQHSPKHT